MAGDIGVLTDLYNALDQQPSSVSVHERLLEVWQGLGEEDMAFEVASALLNIDRKNKAARRYLQSRRPRGSVPAATESRHRPSRRSKQTSYVEDPEFARPLTTQEDWLWAEKKLEEGYTSLKLEAQLLREEIEAVCALGGTPMDDEEAISNLQAIGDGRVSAAVALAPPPSVRELARVIMSTSGKAQELIAEDFEAISRWGASQKPPLGPDGIRERLVKRKTLLEAALPQSMEHLTAAALTQIEREHLQKKYVNTKTMLHDPIEDIPKENFFVSEDNYAWDMEELAQALVSNDGVMRNPMSKEMFSESDIHRILTHPHGQQLKPLQMVQSQLKGGARSKTIDWIQKLGRIMLEDQSVTAAPSRQAMDEFLAYAATLPESEQKTINSLKVPARDSHTGQAFDYTIGESVRDAKANTTCFHKTGDFLSQAAAYLRRQ
ncbi:MAG: hypothetical protein M1840_003796 [Geoglossum simile]|nr:MAG: hypothetical protein M1840_003796 [Geoglossum simile]